MNDLTRDLAGDLLLFLAILTAAVWAGVAATTLRSRRNARREAMHRHPSNNRCGMRSDHGAPCTRPGTERVFIDQQGATKVCVGHLDEGSVLGWWKS